MREVAAQTGSSPAAPNQPNHPTNQANGDVRRPLRCHTAALSIQADEIRPQTVAEVSWSGVATGRRTTMIGDTDGAVSLVRPHSYLITGRTHAGRPCPASDCPAEEDDSHRKPRGARPPPSPHCTPTPHHASIGPPGSTARQDPAARRTSHPGRRTDCAPEARPRVQKGAGRRWHVSACS